MKLPPPRTLAALGVPNTSSNLTSGNWKGEFYFPWKRALFRVQGPVLWTGFVPAKIPNSAGFFPYIINHHIETWLPLETKLPSLRTMASIRVPNASSKMTSGNWGDSNSERRRISPGPKLPPPRTLAAFGVLNTSSKLTSGNWGVSFVSCGNRPLFVSRGLCP
ncbi:hypothetical protein IHE44_0008266, partial [Lamprotornis superbus]